MTVLSSASTEDIKRLLELFPLKALKKQWPKAKATKEEICSVISSSKKSKDILDFVDGYFSCCKQHIYIFSHDDIVKKLPLTGRPDGDKVFEATGDKTMCCALYLFWAEYTVVLSDPLEQTTIKFLWPVRFELTKRNVVIRFVVLEKNIGAHFPGRSCHMGKRTIEEHTVLQALLKPSSGLTTPTDIHRGLKALWKGKSIDCTRAQYKKPVSTATEIMDEERGVREHNPDLYDVLLVSPLFNAHFSVSAKFSGVSVFATDPSSGYLAFPRYTEDKGDTDHVVREILRHNG